MKIHVPYSVGAAARHGTTRPGLIIVGVIPALSPQDTSLGAGGHNFLRGRQSVKDLRSHAFRESRGPSIA